MTIIRYDWGVWLPERKHSFLKDVIPKAAYLYLCQLLYFTFIYIHSIYHMLCIHTASLIIFYHKSFIFLTLCINTFNVEWKSCKRQPILCLLMSTSVRTDVDHLWFFLHHSLIVATGWYSLSCHFFVNIFECCHLPSYIFHIYTFIVAPV